ncbi:SPRY domain-containing protein [Pleurostoma richardsiae]|uniref:SPRY domain-containing protein n=1 Tax=Pleurostoma richardsiae TaxID=41990 RepID=A0AA38S6T9_9PEZI|nr:SPRY domain-containing protein [Pleurostoma richardsiae]
MCFGSKSDAHEEEAPRPAQIPLQQQQSKAKPQLPSNNDMDIAPPPGPPPKQQQSGGNFAAGDVAPPPGPPPSHQLATGSNPQADYAPPPGPPPSHYQATGSNAIDDYAPPPGLPPSRQPGSSNPVDDDYGPPPGPPPSSRPVVKPEHDWQALVPDTALFPPPPDIFSGYDRSPATNAPEAEASAGEAWCAEHPLSPPAPLDAAALEALRTHNLRLLAPAPPTGRFMGALEWAGPGVWRGQTDRRSRDSCVLGYPPLYSAAAHSPLATRRPRTIYYEVRVGERGTPARDICLAVGFAALPYPSFRMPGWHRGSLAVHGDDGHRYVNDRWGGKDFVRPFGRGQTVGVGMRLAEGQGESTGKIDVEVFFTRQGREEGRWNLHEETDAQQDLPVTGLEGFHDLVPALGTFGEVSFEVVFDPARWLYKGVVE